MPEGEWDKIRADKEALALDAGDDSLPDTLAVDDDSMDESDILEDVEEEIERIRSAARTVFRQHANDIDTV